MTLAEWGNPTALFSYRLKRLSTVEIRAGCRFWVTPASRGHNPRKKKATFPAGDARKWLFGRKNVRVAPASFPFQEEQWVRCRAFLRGASLLSRSQQGTCLPQTALLRSNPPAPW